MHLSVCVSFFFKKQIHPWFCKEFHRHRMNLCCLHRDIPMLFDRITSRNISLERMTTLMCHNIHISACSIEIGKNKRCTVFRKICHISTGFFRLSSQNIKQLIFHHEVKKLFRFRRKFFVHFLSIRHDFFRRALWFWIASGKIHILINIRKLFQTQSLSSVLMHLLCQRNKILFDLSAEILNFFFSIGITVHPVISKFYIIVISKKSCLLGTILHQLIVNLIQFCRLALEECTVLVMCFSSDLAVFMCHIRTE